jgi:hypothetical protein
VATKQEQPKQLVAEESFVALIDGRAVQVPAGEVVLSTDPVAEVGKAYLRELEPEGPS